MSVRKIQTERVVQDIARGFYSTGVNPTLNAVLGKIAEYFAKFPAGNPLPLPINYVEADRVSDVDKFNEALARIAMNLDVLYEASMGQVDEILMLSTALRQHLDRLSVYRKRVETLIDDYLLSLYNTDGYYYSISDTFSDTSFTDLGLTSAFIDTTIGAVTLPVLGSLTTRLSSELIHTPTIQTFFNDAPITFRELATWSGAIDGFSNTVWQVQVAADKSGEAVAYLTFNVGDANNPVQMSRLDFDPYGIVPVQMYVETGTVTNTGTLDFQSFGNKIDTSLNKMSFVDNLREVSVIRITLRKTTHDFVDNSGGVAKFVYVFGAKDISIIEQAYDDMARFVSYPLSITSDLDSEFVIDAVSLSTTSETPPSTSITYYLAEDTDTDNPQMSDFNWQRIDPIGTLESGRTIIRFDGAQSFIRNIRTNPIGNDLKLIPLDTSNVDLSRRNPSPVLVPGIDVYRIAAFNEEPPVNSLKLEEGINTTRIYYTALVNTAVNGLGYWAPLIQGAAPPPTVYGQTDTGNDFFYGGDIGESGKSVYVETYLESLQDQETFLGEFIKPDPNSLFWDVRVFLNGRDIGFLPATMERLTLPWNFRQGMNHIALLINIPRATSTLPNPYIGTVQLMGDRDLSDFGTVKLGDWSFVSWFDMQYNQTGLAPTFTIHDGEILSRKKPTTNFRLQYASPTGAGPGAIRLRADLSRQVTNPHVSPKLTSYRLRFSYGSVV